MKNLQPTLTRRESGNLTAASSRERKATMEAVKWYRKGVDYETTRFHIGSGLRLYAKVTAETNQETGNGLVFRIALEIENANGTVVETVPGDQLVGKAKPYYLAKVTAKENAKRLLLEELANKGVYYESDMETTQAERVETAAAETPTTPPYTLRRGKESEAFIVKETLPLDVETAAEPTVIIPLAEAKVLRQWVNEHLVGKGLLPTAYRSFAKLDIAILDAEKETQTASPS